jgi:hypothetical protein
MGRGQIRREALLLRSQSRVGYQCDRWSGATGSEDRRDPEKEVPCDG